METYAKTSIKKELVKYLLNLGIDVHTSTKARGNNGFFRDSRIDISKNLDDSSAIKTILHEFGHYLNFKLDNKFKNSYLIFNTDFEELKEELITVTNFVDENSLCKNLIEEREKIKKTIKNLTKNIRTEYPKFSPSEEFKPFKKFARWSNISYLEKHDRIKLINWFSVKTFSLSTIKKDFPNTPEVFIDYLKLKSKQRKRAKISRRINKLNKYYSTPTELFARFIEGLYIDKDFVKELAPNTYNRFVELYHNNYYENLNDIFDIVGIYI